jgi:hypothetical protein
MKGTPEPKSGWNNSQTHGCVSSRLALEDMDSDLRPTTDNFLPDLGACVEFRSLMLRAHVFGATTADLALAFKDGKRLRVLRLSRHTDHFVDEAVIKSMAKHLSLKELYLEKSLRMRLLSAIANSLCGSLTAP